MAMPHPILGKREGFRCIGVIGGSVWFRDQESNFEPKTQFRFTVKPLVTFEYLPSSFCHRAFISTSDQPELLNLDSSKEWGWECGWRRGLPD